MCGRFQKTTHYTLHATACLDQHLIMFSSPTVLHNYWLSLQPCGHPSPAAVSLSLSLCLCMRGVSFQWQSTALQYVAAVYCMHRQSAGKLPSEVSCWACSSGLQVAVVMRHTGLWPTHITQLTHFVGHTPDVLAWHQITASPQTFAHAIKPTCRVFWTTSIASCCSFVNLLIMCMHSRTFLRARK